MEKREGEKNVNAAIRLGGAPDGQGPVTIVVPRFGPSSAASFASMSATVAADPGVPIRLWSSDGSVVEVEQLAVAGVVA